MSFGKKKKKWTYENEHPHVVKRSIENYSRYLGLLGVYHTISSYYMRHDITTRMTIF